MGLLPGCCCRAPRREPAGTRSDGADHRLGEAGRAKGAAAEPCGAQMAGGRAPIPCIGASMYVAAAPAGRGVLAGGAEASEGPQAPARLGLAWMVCAPAALLDGGPPSALSLLQHRALARCFAGRVVCTSVAIVDRQVLGRCPGAAHGRHASCGRGGTANLALRRRASLSHDAHFVCSDPTLTPPRRPVCTQLPPAGAPTERSPGGPPPSARPLYSERNVGVTLLCRLCTAASAAAARSRRRCSPLASLPGRQPWRRPRPAARCW